MALIGATALLEEVWLGPGRGDDKTTHRDSRSHVAGEHDFRYWPNNDQQLPKNNKNGAKFRGKTAQAAMQFSHLSSFEGFFVWAVPSGTATVLHWGLEREGKEDSHCGDRIGYISRELFFLQVDFEDGCF